MSAKPKLLARPDVDESMIQLTAWIALSDSTISNGCLRMLEGSFTDARFEAFGQAILKQKLRYILNLNQKGLDELLRVMLFSSGNFAKAQLAFEHATKQIPDLFTDMQVNDVEVKAGEFVIFSSLLVHGSYPNQTKDETRLAFTGRYTTNCTRVYPDMKTDHFPTREGMIKFNLDKVKCIQVLGEDRFGHNSIA